MKDGPNSAFQVNPNQKQSKIGYVALANADRHPCFRSALANWNLKTQQVFLF